MGKVKRLRFCFADLKKKNKEEKTGYLIEVSPAIENRKEYRLFKSNEGKWSQDPHELIKLEDETLLAI